jgi:cytochrome c oxidase subunit 1
MMFTNLYLGLIKGRKTTARNPWGGETLEWSVETPPSLENFEAVPDNPPFPYTYADNDVEPAHAKEGAH